MTPAVQLLERGYLPSRHYGMSHLLRLLVVLPELINLGVPPATPEQRSLLQDALKHFRHYLLVRLAREHAPAEMDTG